MVSDIERNQQVCELVAHYQDVYHQREKSFLCGDMSAVARLNDDLQRLVEEIYECIEHRVRNRVSFLLQNSRWRGTAWSQDATCYQEFIDNGVHGFVYFILAKLHRVKLKPEPGPIEYLLTIAERDAKRSFWPRRTRPPLTETSDALPPICHEQLPSEEEWADPDGERAYHQLHDRLFAAAVKEALLEYVAPYPAADRILILDRLIWQRPYAEIAATIREKTGERYTNDALRQRFSRYMSAIISCLQAKGLLP